MVTIPFVDSADFSIEVTLDNTPFNIRFIWNSRADFLYTGFWTMSVADRDQVDIVTGQRLVIQGEYLRQFPGRGLPLGAMSSFDPTGSTAPIEQGDFLSERVFLLYMTAAEFEAL